MLTALTKATVLTELTTLTFERNRKVGSAVSGNHHMTAAVQSDGDTQASWTHIGTLCHGSMAGLLASWFCCFINVMNVVYVPHLPYKIWQLALVGFALSKYT